MFSITLKRSAATLGVVAGLLAAAAPASAGPLGPMDSPNDATTAAVYSPVKSTFQVHTSGRIETVTVSGSLTPKEQKATEPIGTQIGSEG